MKYTISEIELSAILFFSQFDSTSAKITDINVATVSYLNTRCGCSLPRSHVFEDEFACADNDAQEVIYRAKLQGAEATDCKNLTQYLSEWIKDESSIRIQRNRLELDPSCDLEIESLDVRAQCVINEMTSPTTTSPPTATTGDGLSLEIIIGAAAGGATLLILFLLWVLVVCCICCRRSKRK